MATFKQKETIVKRLFRVGKTQRFNYVYQSPLNGKYIYSDGIMLVESPNLYCQSMLRENDERNLSQFLKRLNNENESFEFNAEDLDYIFKNGKQTITQNVFKHIKVTQGKNSVLLDPRKLKDFIQLLDSNGNYLLENGKAILHKDEYGELDGILMGCYLNNNAENNAYIIEK